MSYRYLLDTNILSDLVRHPQGRVAEKIIQRGKDTICTSIVVAAELRFGAEKKDSDQLSEKIGLLLSTIAVLPCQFPADLHYASLRNELEKTGTLIGPNDMLIAVHTLALDLTLVTVNVKGFSYVPDLKVENWLN